MVNAYSSAADFSGISKDTKLRLDSDHHKVFIPVDKGATEAAAASAGAILLSLPARYVANRPFIFIGRVDDPRAG